VGRKLRCLRRIELRDLLNRVDELGPHTAYTNGNSCLRDESDQLPKMRCLFVRVDLKDSTRRVVVIPLLQELFFV
jgi:hypothetical protein